MVLGTGTVESFSFNLKLHTVLTDLCTVLIVKATKCKYTKSVLNGQELLQLYISFWLVYQER